MPSSCVLCEIDKIDPATIETGGVWTCPHCSRRWLVTPSEDGHIVTTLDAAFTVMRDWNRGEDPEPEPLRPDAPCPEHREVGAEWCACGGVTCVLCHHPLRGEWRDHPTWGAGRAHSDCIEQEAAAAS